MSVQVLEMEDPFAAFEALENMAPVEMPGEPGSPEEPEPQDDPVPMEALVEVAPPVEEPVVEEPVAEVTVAEEPVAEVAVVEVAPPVEEPVVEEPVAEVTVAEVPVVEDPVPVMVSLAPTEPRSALAPIDIIPGVDPHKPRPRRKLFARR